MSAPKSPLNLELDFSRPASTRAKKPASRSRRPAESPRQSPDLVIHIDGASRGNPGPAGIGVVIKNESGSALWKSGQSIGTATNNVAEYQALITALKSALALTSGRVLVYSDSELLVRQVRGEYRIKNPGLRQLFREVEILASQFQSFKISHIPREENREADRLASQATLL
ncbi:MAG: ribonuclease HI family protein [Proteobacteria bacterium]|nr:ribonuclease HI family protein [Pseudomonadota bacterium]